MFFIRDCRQNLLPLFSEFEQIDQLLFPWKLSENHDFRGNKRQFAQSHLIMKAKLGDNPILLTKKIRLLPHLLFLRRVLGVYHSKGIGVLLKVIRFSLPTSLNKLFSTWPLLDGISPKHLL